MAAGEELTSTQAESCTERFKGTCNLINTELGEFCYTASGLVFTFGLRTGELSCGHRGGGYGGHRVVSGGHSVADSLA